MAKDKSIQIGISPEDLAKIGIMDISTKLHPRKFFVPILGEVKIPEYYNYEDIFSMLYKKGYEDGIDSGKQLKQEEIRSVLGIVSDNN